MENDSSRIAEINRLKYPLKYNGLKAYDSRGNQVDCVETVSDLKYVMEPDANILTDEEILEYAPNSREASKIRLKKGMGSNSDVLVINNSIYWILALYYTILVCITIPAFYSANKIGMLFIVILAILPLLYLYYIFNLKEYEDKDAKRQISKSRFSGSEVQSEIRENEGLESLKKYADEVEELKALFESKEMAVRNLIEKRFEPPQITYDRFMATIDKSHELFCHEADSALNITKLAVEDTQRVEEELDNKINTLKSIIDQIEELTNELVINIGNDDESGDDIKGLVEDMENLIDSVKEYN